VNEHFARINDDIELCYETFGDPSDPTVLLVMGLGTQMIAWHEDFCAQLVDRGFHVVRFDNRDIGRSTHLTDVPAPTVTQLLRRDKRAAAYRLEDLAADAIGLLDHIGVEKAHVVGASMGGMIAQTIAAKYPDRVGSLVSIMSNTGSRWTGQPAFTVMPVLLKAPPKQREAYVDFIEKVHETIGSTELERDIESVRQMADVSYDRRQDPRGAGRQLAAILASGDRTAELKEIRCPTLVIHGTADKLVRPSGGKATAKAIPGAELMLIDGMGHDLPRAAWDRIIDGIVRMARRAGAPVGDPETQAA
jgi:pimeloyl-ACP methyl ester carboxylesterase